MLRKLLWSKLVSYWSLSIKLLELVRVEYATGVAVWSKLLRSIDFQFYSFPKLRFRKYISICTKYYLI